MWIRSILGAQSQRSPERYPMSLVRRKWTYHVPSLIVLLALFAATGASAATAFPSARPIAPIRGVPQVGATGVSRTTSDIMREEASHAGEPQEPIELENEHRLPSRSGLPQNPLAPRLAS